MSIRFLCVVLWFDAAAAASPLVVKFNETRFFGYDGPWQAVPVTLGSPPQTVHMFPGGRAASTVPSENVMNFDSLISDNYSYASYRDEAEIFDAGQSNPESYGSTQNYYIKSPENGGVNYIDGGWGGKWPSNAVGWGQTLTDVLTLPNGQSRASTVQNATISAGYNITYHLPDGRAIPLDVGFLSMGGQDNQHFGDIIGYGLPLNLSDPSTEDGTPSNLWTLHIGSYRPRLAASLILGGYDSRRVVGNVTQASISTRTGGMLIDLRDIGIDVAEGASPFSFQSKSGMLKHDGGNHDTISVQIDPTLPYMYLPEQTCKALAAVLPVTYIEALDLYAWNTESPDYEKIVKSPAHLKFTFVSSVDNDFSIKVPFALLNLTLTPPLVDTEQAYFPCKSYAMPDDVAPESADVYFLGRAFLQAAFVGVNWSKNRGIWWLAQAPGPGAITEYIEGLDNSTEELPPGTDGAKWFDGWKSVLEPLSSGEKETDQSNGHGQDDQGSGLPQGTKLGLGIGLGVGLSMAVLAAALFWFRRRRTQASKISGFNTEAHSAGGRGDHHESFYHQKSELEAPSQDQLRTSQPVYELTGDTAAPTPVSEVNNVSDISVDPTDGTSRRAE